MTKNKRFKNVEENLEWGTIQYFTYYDEKITDKELEKLVNHLLNQNDDLNDENEQLKQQLEHIQDIFSIINGYLQDDGVLTLEKYTEIEDYIYDQWKKGDVE